MPDTSMPFRPRAGPVAGALSSIEAQTVAARRRLNRFALERALFVAGGAALVGFSLLVGLAFVLSRGQYAVAAWSLLVMLAFVLLARMRRLRRAWLLGADAAVVIDHRVVLEDRLATLASAHETARQSRLWDYLLHENLRLLPRWEPRRLEPRSMPGSVWFFATSLLVALAALWMTSPLGRGRGALPSAGGPEPGPQAAEDQQDAEELGPSPSFWSKLPESLRQAILGSKGSRNFAGDIPEKTLPVDDERGGPAIAGKHMNNHGPVQSGPAAPDSPRSAGGPGSTTDATAPRNSQRPPQGQGEASSRPARGDAPKALERVESGRSPSQMRGAQAKAGGSGGGGPGAGTGGDKDGLLGERQAVGKTSGSFTLDLDAMRSAQQAKEGDSDTSPSVPPSRLADDQRLDDAVRRAQVPVEYEAIVQRIFNRAAGTAEPSAGVTGGER